MKRAAITFVLSLLSIVVFCDNYIVTNTNDTGDGSLRQAIIDAQTNIAGLPHTITFNIPASDPGYNAATGVWTIVYTEEGLPPITTGYITIDGFSQTDFAGDTNPLGPEVCLNGSLNTVEFCFQINNAANNVIKGFIINEFLYGVQIYGPQSQNNIIKGNYMGTNFDGTERRGNYNAVEIISGANQNQIGGTAIEERNLMSGNEYAGIRISDASNNLIINNWVGVDRTGTQVLFNYDGITIEGASAYNQIGGDEPEERNISSGNVAYGIDIFGVGCKGNMIQGNYLGTDVTGTYALPNTYGILFDDRSHNNQVGGYNPGEGNLISGNTAFGAYFYNNGTNSNTLIGNKIGTDITGTSAIPNETGVHIDGATYGNIADSNLISGNRANGITLFATYTDYNTIIRNKIGTDITGTLPLGNGLQGILITQGSANNTIGGSAENANIIAFNGRNGIKIESENADHNYISQNSIHRNGYLGIELYPNEGMNPNDEGDVDTGPNDLMNTPVITWLEESGAQANMYGIIDVADPSSTRIEIYRAFMNENAIAEGKEFLGFTYSDTDGNWSFNLPVHNPGDFYTTLAIDNTGNTSEFSMEYPDQSTILSTKSVNRFSGTVSPNPCKQGELIIISNNDRIYNEVSVYDVSGNMIHSGKLKKEETQIPTKNLKPGSYILMFTGENVPTQIYDKIVIFK